MAEIMSSGKKDEWVLAYQKVEISHQHPKVIHISMARNQSTNFGMRNGAILSLVTKSNLIYMGPTVTRIIRNTRITRSASTTLVLMGRAGDDLSIVLL